ncbi:MAG TPA: hypothetical protein VMY37_16330 [Thermoguttaceae bacterium]|nr:hypothetical protein [Thermoguttaceae bacterium]
MEIHVKPDLEGEEFPDEVFANVIEFALVGTRSEEGFPHPIRRSHVRQVGEPFDLIEKLEGLKTQLVCYACRIDKG